MHEVLSAVPKRMRADAVWLLSSLLKMSKTELLLEGRRELSGAESGVFNRWWSRRMKGQPLQYVAGSAPFYGRDFRVDRRVLIPRPETECLVELALGLLRDRPSARVLEIGTGSGAIAITLGLEMAGLTITATDWSRSALRVAVRNANELGASGISFQRQNLFSPVLRQKGWDLVISNPPYLEFGRDYIAPDVKKYEPRVALEPSPQVGRGLGITRAAWCAERILQGCEECRPAYTALELSPRVALFLERRWKKRDSVKRAWREADLAGRKRFLLVSWKET